MRSKLIIALTTLLTQMAVAAEGSFSACREITGIKERVACYDRLVDASRIKPVKETADLPGAEDLFGKQESEVLQIVKQSLAAKEGELTQTSLKFVEQIESAVTEVKRSVGRKLTIALENGQVWQQLDNGPMSLKTGEIITIRAARLGSFLMRKQSGSGSIRVKRRL